MKKLLSVALASITLLTFSSCGKKVTPLEISKPATQAPPPIVLNEKTPGGKVDITNLVGKENRYTLVEFYADWCGPCQAFLPIVNMLPKKFNNLAVYRVNIDKWKSPVCQQFQINSVPAMIVYGPDGKELAKGEEARQWVQAQLDLLADYENSQLNKH